MTSLAPVRSFAAPGVPTLWAAAAYLASMPGCVLYVGLGTAQTGEGSTEEGITMTSVETTAQPTIPGQTDAITCDAGPCCDPDGFFRLAGHTCLDDAESEYGCPWGVGAGDDVGVHRRDRTCSGSSSACDGSFAPWEGWQTADDCSAEELCEPGQMMCQSSCQASTYWSPSSTSDDRWDLQAIQKLTLKKQEVSGDLVRVQVCKPVGNFLNDIHLDYEEWGKHNGLFMYSGTVSSFNQNCSDEVALDVANWGEGEILGAQVRVVSPASCADMWDDHCSVDPGCGNCWYWLSDTIMTRTCR